MWKSEKKAGVASSSEQSSDTLTTGSGQVKCGDTNDSDDDGVAATATDDRPPDGDEAVPEDEPEELVDAEVKSGAGGLPLREVGCEDWPCVGE